MESQKSEMRAPLAALPQAERAETARPRRRSFAGIGLALILAALAFLSGMHIGSDMQLDTSARSLFAASKGEQTADLSRFWQVWDLLDDKFVSASSTDAMSEEERIDGAIKGLVEAFGDPYTIYMPPADAALFAEDVSGNFEGVGMEIGSRDGIITVIAPLPGTPAERAGIRSGDKIISIDGASTEHVSVDMAVKRIRGKAGTEVAFTILREGEDELLEITVIRERIDIPTIKTEKKHGVFVIHLYNFSAISEAKFEGALRKYVQSGEKKLLLDLRGNPGGYLQSAVAIASYFLPTGKVVVRENFGEGEDERVYRSAGRLLGKHAPERMAVLVNGGSASASEILAGALSEHSAATLLGTRTFGKGSVQEVVDLKGNASLKVTVARWLTPEGRSISEGGLTPDVEIADPTKEDLEKGGDVQLDAAIEYLNR